MIGASVQVQSPPTHGWRGRAGRYVSPRNVGGIYLMIVIIVIFGAISPDVFFTWATVKQVVNGNTVAALAGLALVIPLSAGVFDVSGGGVMSLSGVMTAYLVSHVNAPLWLAIVVGLLSGVAVGVFNGLIIVYGRIESLIATLASGSLISAFINMATGDNTVNDPRLVGGFSKIAQGSIGGFVYPVVYVLALGLILWFVLEHTPTGRRLYAAGFSAEASRLAGIRVNRLRFMSLVTSSTLAAVAGIVLAAQIGAGSPDAGTPFLLPAFAVVFVGATQFKSGRFNPAGTIVAVVLLGVGVTGLGLIGAPAWAGDMFTGTVLVLALAVTGRQRQSAGGGWSRWRLRRLHPPSATGDDAADEGEDTIGPSSVPKIDAVLAVPERTR